jgi:Predicted permease
MNKSKFMTNFLSLAAAILLLFALFHIGDIKDVVMMFVSGLQPLWVGIAFAYLLCPVAGFFESKLKKLKKVSRYARPLSVLITSLAVLAFFSLLLAVLLPQLITSISDLVPKLPGMLETQLARLQKFLISNNQFASTATELVKSAENTLITWTKTNLLSTVYNLASSLMSVGSAIINVLLAFIIMIYLLLDRERYLNQCRKLFHTFSRNERVNDAVYDTLHQANKMFGGFITGKLIDSLIVGIICFVFMMIFRMDYALIISVIVGITNIIPMFGPFIGAIPSALLLLLVDPKQCIIFMIFIIVLQQVDGNVIGPRIMGDSIGLPALYITIAILMFGSLFGFIGMIIGVPTFATLYYVVKRVSEYFLRKRGLPTDTAAYGPDFRATLHSDGNPEVSDSKDDDED